ncbi:zinc metalloprotease [Natronolimnobius baerhuensis]
MTVMNRRAFLGAIGSVASLGTLAYATRDPIETLEIGVWFSEQAATYDGLKRRIREYVIRCFDFEFWTVDLSFGGPVAVGTEDGARVTSRGEWPLQVGSGAISLGDIDPARHVNLLVTDGQMRVAPTGYGMPRIASVGGARHIAVLESFDDVLETGPETAFPWTVPVTTRVRTMQVLLHEIGHALGLDHEHGAVVREDGIGIATPMLSTYAFGSDYAGEQSHCGSVYPVPESSQRALSLSFSACSRRALAARAADD